MGFKTKKAKENFLNDFYNDTYSEDEVVKQFIYFTNKNRKKYCSENRIRTYYRLNSIGTLLREMDPIAFQTFQI